MNDDLQVRAGLRCLRFDISERQNLADRRPIDDRGGRADHGTIVQNRLAAMAIDLAVRLDSRHLNTL